MRDSVDGNGRARNGRLFQPLSKVPRRPLLLGQVLQRHADVVLRLNIVRITPHDGPKVFQGALIVPVLERENCLSLMVGRRERIAVSGAFLTAPCLGDERRKRPRKTKDRETDS